MANDLHASPDQHYDKCLLHARAEIHRHLKRLLDRRCTLMVQAENDESGMLSVLLGVDDSMLWVDLPPSRALLERWLACRRLHFEGSLDRVAVRFACGPARLDTYRGQPALALPLPERLLHMQRREFMRREPCSALRCRVPTGAEADGEAMMSATIRDISGGGLSLVVPVDSPRFDVGDRIGGCVIELPRMEPMTVALHIRHIVATIQRGRPARQAGCEFVELTPAIQARLLRYIMQLDRERMRRRGT
jgi:c-di-GMP-binding flagellar brake protein YcgR